MLLHPIFRHRSGSLCVSSGQEYPKLKFRYHHHLLVRSPRRSFISTDWWFLLWRPRPLVMMTSAGHPPPSIPNYSRHAFSFYPPNPVPVQIQNATISWSCLPHQSFAFRHGTSRSKFFHTPDFCPLLVAFPFTLRLMGHHSAPSSVHSSLLCRLSIHGADLNTAIVTSLSYRDTIHSHHGSSYNYTYGLHNLIGYQSSVR